VLKHQCFSGLIGGGPAVLPDSCAPTRPLRHGVAGGAFAVSRCRNEGAEVRSVLLATHGVSRYTG